MSADNLLELLFSQSLDGFFFMMLDEPIRWDDEADKDRLLDYVFAHQRVTKVNGAMLAQYGARQEQFIGMTPADFYKHDLEAGRRVWREFFDRGQLHIKTHERRLDGTPIDVEGDYICLYDAERRIIGHFGIQRDVTEEIRLQARSRSTRRSSKNALSSAPRIWRAARTASARSSTRYRTWSSSLTKRVGTWRSSPRRSAHSIAARRSSWAGACVTCFPSQLPRRYTRWCARRSRPAESRSSSIPSTSSEGLRWFEARTAPARIDPAADVRSVVMIVRDITERKRTEELERQNVYLREAFDTDLHFGEIHGRSAAMQEVFRAIELVADTDSSVLILGETGTGKELIARAIHRVEPPASRA